MGYSVLWYRAKYPAVAAYTPDKSFTPASKGGQYTEEATDAVVDLAMQQICYDTQEALMGIYANFPAPFRPVAWLMKALTFPMGRAFAPPSDAQLAKASNAVTTDTAVRKQLMDLVYLREGSRVELINDAFPIAIEADEALRAARKEKRQLTEDEQMTVDKAEEMREEIIQVRVRRERERQRCALLEYRDD